LVAQMMRTSTCFSAVAPTGPWPRAQTYAPVPGPALDKAARRVVLVCGATSGLTDERITEWAAEMGWPVLADPLSGLRFGGHDRSAVIAHYDVLLRDEGWAAAHQPDLVIRIGDTPTSKPLRAWIARAPQLLVDPHLSWHDPTRTADLIVPLAPSSVLLGLAAEQADPEWVESWRRADALVPEALAAAPADLVEPAVCAGLVEQLPAGTTLWVSSSMPIRDMESFAPSSEKPLRVLANRGANGIDGVVSSALGAAIAGDTPVIVLIGELALAHDASGLLAAARAGARLGIVCLNNGGGGIFDFLPLAEHAEAGPYEEHIATPIPTDVAALASIAGMRHVLAQSAADAAAQAAAGVLVEVRGDRAANVRGHRELFKAVAAKLAGDPVTPGAGAAPAA
jgi:2-succinyl-5-enolpyruvyl-6-hydroxy-3-cyclohexene-1-carboxylate synthase